MMNKKIFSISFSLILSLAIVQGIFGQSMSSIAEISISSKNLPYLDQQLEEFCQKSIKECSSYILTESENTLSSNLLLMGNIEDHNNRININFKLLNVETGEIEKSIRMDFASIKKEVRHMIKVTLQALFNTDKKLVSKKI